MVDLSDERFLNLMTFRPSGAEVATPVWFAEAERSLYVGTFADSGKVRRIQANPSVRFAAANYRGLERSDYAGGTAEVLEGDEAERAELVLQEKYGWQWKTFSRRIDCFLRIDPE